MCSCVKPFAQPVSCVDDPPPQGASWLSPSLLAALCHLSRAVFPDLESEMATHSSIFAWKIPWTDEPGGLQPMGSQRVRHDWMSTNTCFSDQFRKQYLWHSMPFYHSCSPKYSAIPQTQSHTQYVLVTLVSDKSVIFPRSGIASVLSSQSRICLLNNRVRNKFVFSLFYR